MTPQLLMDLVTQVGDWVIGAGFRRLLILNGHVTNAAPLRCALEMLRQAPQRVLGLALVDTSARPDTPESRANREKQIERARTQYPALVEELLAKWIHPSHLQDPDVAGIARAMALARSTPLRVAFKKLV